MAGNEFLKSMLSTFIFALTIALVYIFLWWISKHRRDPRELDATLQLQAVVHNNGGDTITTTTTTTTSPTTARGLPPLIIASLPIFLYRENQDEHGMRECAVCLSSLEDEEIGMLLPNCKHMFHAQCIIMWLISSSTCPICRCDVKPHALPSSSPLVGERMGSRNSLRT